MNNKPFFVDRRDAGKKLASELVNYKNDRDAIVLALPRGGIAVATEMADRLSLPLDILLVRKLGVPCHEEFAMGAISSGGGFILNNSIVKDLAISQEQIAAVKDKEELELKRRELCYRGNRAAPELTGKTIILVDDGIATGASIKAAILSLKKSQPLIIVLAIPLAPLSTLKELKSLVSHCICLHAPEPFSSVSMYYEDFAQYHDDDVIRMLKKYWDIKDGRSR